MSLNDLSNNVQEINHNSRDYLEKSLAFYRLSLFKKVTRGISTLIKFMIVGGVLLLAIFMLSIAAAFAIDRQVDNLMLSFFLVALSLIILALLIFYLFRKKLDKIILIKASRDFLDD